MLVFSDYLKERGSKSEVPSTSRMVWTFPSSLLPFLTMALALLQQQGLTMSISLVDMVGDDWSLLVREVEVGSIGHRSVGCHNCLDLSSNGSLLAVGAVWALDGTGEVKVINLKAVSEEEGNEQSCF